MNLDVHARLLDADVDAVAARPQARSEALAAAA